MYIKDLDSFKEALDLLEDYRGIDRDTIISSIKDGIVSAYLKTYGEGEIEVIIDEDFVIKLYKVKIVVEEIQDNDREITLADARIINVDAALEDEILLEEQSEDFRRNAVQNAKQIIIQRVREAERNNLVDKFESKKGKLVTGIIRRIDPTGNVFMDLDGVETILTTKEQSPTDRYKIGDTMKVVILDVLSNTKMPRVSISRRSALLIRELFAFEVPEIAEGVVEIKSVAREAGFRSKIAIHSESESIDPIGACVGNKSMRIRSIIDELNGEKIDIIIWNPNIEEFIANSLKPAEVERVKVRDSENARNADVFVKEDQLSLAIGKKGQNARLASRLTNCKINIETV